MAEGQQDVNLRYTSPVLTADGHVIIIGDNDLPTLLFFQGREQHEGHLHADVVAAVRLNSVDELKNLGKAIDETIKKHKDREP